MDYHSCAITSSRSTRFKFGCNEHNKGCLRLAFFIRHSAGCVTVVTSARRENSSV